MSRLLAIDPGNVESGWVIIDADTRKPIKFAKTPNYALERMLNASVFGLAEVGYDRAVIEMVASYGMPVGAEVFETCVWIGRFHSACMHNCAPTLVKRQPVKVHHCHSARAKDSNIVQALVDRFAPGEPNRGKGTKASPGWFYGFANDVWQAYALAVYVADKLDPTGAAS